MNMPFLVWYAMRPFVSCYIVLRWFYRLRRNTLGFGDRRMLIEFLESPEAAGTEFAALRLGFPFIDKLLRMTADKARRRHMAVWAVKERGRDAL